MLLDARDVRVDFATREGPRLVAVDGVHLSLRAGEICGLVGESGSGKTVFSLALLRLIDSAGARSTGQILWRGKDLAMLAERELREVRGREIAMVFQNAQASLNPSLTIGAQLGALLRYRRGMSKAEARAESLRLLRAVLLTDAERVLTAYPHECSGGMCHRIAVALALSLQPRLIIADEPTASLDVTIQAQIVELLRQVREEFGVAILLITHDFGVVANLCDRVAVMYLGQIVETGPTALVYREPKHPYTQALLASLLSPDPAQARRSTPIIGETPSSLHLPQNACRFTGRCPKAFDRCRVELPMLTKIDANDRLTACFFYGAEGRSLSNAALD